MKDAMDKVREFHKKAGFPYYDNISFKSIGNRIARKELRMALIKEEYEEYLQAEYEDNITEVADSLADLIYVIVGASLEYGIPLDKVFDEIQQSNMSKFPDGKCIYREDGKILKPDTYKPPNVKKILYGEEDG